MGLLDRMRLRGRGEGRPREPAADTAEADALRLVEEGNGLEDAGRIDDALARYDAALRLAPALARAHLNRGNALLALDDAVGAAGAYANALSHAPDYAAAHYNLGNAYVRLQRREEALAAYRRALELKADFADAAVALGALHEVQGQAAEAEASYRRALAINPGYAAVHGNLGNVLQRQGQFEAAIASYRRGLELDPHLPGVRSELGNTLQRLGRHEDAIASYRQALAGNPDSVPDHFNLGNALLALGRDEEAVASYRRALASAPDDATIHNNLGNALRRVGWIDEALISFRRAVEIAPDLADAHFNLGNAFRDVMRGHEAIASYRHALALDPEHLNATCMLGNLAMENLRLGEALAHYRRMLEIDPLNVLAHNNIGDVYRRLGRPGDAVEWYERTLRLDPDLAGTQSNMLFLLAGQESPALLAKSRTYGALVARQAHSFDHWPNDPAPDRRLRIGFVSGDLRNHPVGYFIDSVLASLAAAAPDRLEIHAYSNCVFVDKVSARIKASCHGWHLVEHLNDEQLAARIRTDAIDILVDLAGHTAFNRLQVFAWKPAPVQAAWLGYFATTGVAAIDYLIADPWTLSPVEEPNFTEAIWRLPETRLCFTPPDEDIEVGPLPAAVNGYLTFGCFNHLAKMNDAVVALWARVLEAVPGSHLLLKSGPIQEAAVRQRIVERFAAHGVPAGRLDLEGAAPRAEYLAAYRRVDIALDPFPFPGGTTSVEGLWMGVPVLTLAGKSFLARQGLGLMMNAGLPDWVAADADDYVARAAAHAADLGSLVALRSGLRAQVLASPIFDAPRFARNFEGALRGMWQRWCAQRAGRC